MFTVYIVHKTIQTITNHEQLQSRKYHRIKFICLINITKKYTKWKKSHHYQRAQEKSMNKWQGIVKGSEDLKSNDSWYKLDGSLLANPENDRRVASALTLKSTFCLP